MYALVDCNSFFCSVERVFHAGLRHKPLVVLSSNDGCIVALTPEAKAIGLHRGDPIFQVEDIVKAHHVEVFSGNMYLYAAMSKRITSILRHSIHQVENYSIDESFCNLTGYGGHFDLVGMMRDIGRKIQLWTDIPVSIGIAPTKTLAKMGSKFAKQYRGYKGVCLIESTAQRRKALSMFDLSDVWGIGRHTLECLNYHGISTPLEFADKSEAWVKSHLHKSGVQTWLELNGIPVIDTSEVVRRKTICTSRSFGDMVSDLASLKAAVASFSASCANKLRADGSAGKTVSVFLYSNRFREDLPQYNNTASVSLLLPTSDTMELTQAALRVLSAIFHPDILYKKAGVIISDIVSATPMQTDLFDTIHNRQERNSLMNTTDRLNHRYGLKTIRLAVEGTERQAWMVKSDHRSPNYLTDITQLLTIRI